MHLLSNILQYQIK